ncbi:hypothetical protein DUI87_15933 [Hirundo rustica rustica]|uniref:Uncharacterized protein n=1 Tax=Hirundo rustica rustica TaxID=333673 RepID=A0A3M0KH79_HIRRU|nr:hypothetical protein DUI87_15933 [Hirundo rustica rustica]
MRGQWSIPTMNHDWKLFRRPLVDSVFQKPEWTQIPGLGEEAVSGTVHTDIPGGSFQDWAHFGLWDKRFKKGKVVSVGKLLQPEERRVRICERSSPADTKVSGAGGGRTPGASADSPAAHGEDLGGAAVLLLAIEAHGRAEIHLQMEDCRLEQVDA